MKDFLSVIQLLKRFGIYIYTGNKLDDIELIMEEVAELYENGLIMKEDYLKAILILREERKKF
ncbi:YqgQ family protein [Sporosarcina pasteurii]|uniref:Uncharacterized protein conserved in bacteria n=1 Tax=Sporosarcina pasteurii TaxID=1474 RepID=A0A380BQD8_SPOPA|nr:YqgQ family protein [Sporosarcina pasteurii]MDS9471068.1 YqgQ family protein [Sporosarcina pasteurii]QBQ05289.1 DUF910 family protein [Sporosarcina pasteurii]SUJ04241.1 Uncharacterized protein conserved in bacteria [Sporosarcina pasteurii]